MADERQPNRSGNDELEQDGMGRDAAHGGRDESVSGGSYGRNTGRAGGGDLLDTGADSAASRGADVPRGTDEQAADTSSARTGGSSSASSGAASGDDDAIDLDERPEVSRRDPTR